MNPISEMKTTKTTTKRRMPKDENKYENMKKENKYKLKDLTILIMKTMEKCPIQSKYLASFSLPELGSALLQLVPSLKY